jgi:hypothetical protein
MMINLRYNDNKLYLYFIYLFFDLDGLDVNQIIQFLSMLRLF